MAKTKQSKSAPMEALYVQRSPARVTWQIKFNNSVIDCRDTRSSAIEYATSLAKSFHFRYYGVYTS